MTEEKDIQGKVKPAGEKPKRVIKEHMTYTIGEVLKTLPGFDKLPKLIRRPRHGK